VQSKLSELRQEAASIQLQLAVPDLAQADADALQQQLSATTQVISKLEAEMNSLTAPPTTSDTTGTTVPSDMDVLVLQRRISDLQSQYIDLSLRLVDLGTTGDLNGDVTVIDRTPSNVGRRIAAAGGLVVGLLIALGVVLALDAVRRPLRGTGDVVIVPSLGLIEPAASKERGSAPWYAGETKTRRKGQIQSVRAALTAAISSGSTLGVGPLGVSTDDARLLAADLAASVAATGREVLLLDATFSDGLPITEYGDASVTVTDLVSLDQPAREAALGERAETMPSLRGFRSGAGGVDPADLVAGRRFAGLLDDVADLGYALIVAMPATDSTVGEELTQVLDQVLLAGRLKHTTDQQLTDIVEGLASRRATAAGIVLLTGREKLRYEGVRRGKRTSRTASEPEGEAVSEPEPEESVEASTEPEPHGEPELEIVVEERVEPEPPVEPGPQAEPEHPAGQSRRERRLRAVPNVEPEDASRETPADVPSAARADPPDEPVSAPRRVEPPPGSVSGPRVRLEPVAPDAAPSIVVPREPPAPPAQSPAVAYRNPKHAATGAIDEEDRSTLTIVPEAEIEVDETTRVVISRDQLGRSAERLLVAAVSALVAAPGGLTDVPRRLVDVEGMVPVTEGLGSPTAAERLVLVLPDLLRPMPATLTHMVEETLGCVFGLDSDETCRRRIEGWVRHRFVSVSRGDVWLLSSSAGSIQLLVNGSSFDTDKVRLLLAHDVRLLKIRLGRASRSDEDSPAADRLTDVSEFDATLRHLLALAETEPGAFDWHNALKVAGLLAGEKV